MPRERAPEVPRDGVLACDPAGAPSVRIHRRDVGDFALYEVNGRDAPVALPRFFAP
jgi:hypothetical protein